MDSTVIMVECIDELADYLGVKPQVSAITRRTMNGELDFVAALQARVALLEGLPVEVFDEVFRERVRLMPGARTPVRTMRSWGARAALVSGGFVPFVERVGRRGEVAPSGYSLPLPSGKRSATKRRSPWRSISSRTDFLSPC